MKPLHACGAIQMEPTKDKPAEQPKDSKTTAPPEMARGLSPRDAARLWGTASAADTRIQKREIFLLMTLQSKPKETEK